jgi:hypothetical protein
MLIILIIMEFARPQSWSPRTTPRLGMSTATATRTAACSSGAPSTRTSSRIASPCGQPASQGSAGQGTPHARSRHSTTWCGASRIGGGGPRWGASNTLCAAQVSVAGHGSWRARGGGGARGAGYVPVRAAARPHGRPQQPQQDDGPQPALAPLRGCSPPPPPLARRRRRRRRSCPRSSRRGHPPSSARADAASAPTPVPAPVPAPCLSALHRHFLAAPAPEYQRLGGSAVARSAPTRQGGPVEGRRGWGVSCHGTAAHVMADACGHAHPLGMV